MESGLASFCLWDFWASYSHCFTCECVQKGRRTSLFGAAKQHKGTRLSMRFILLCLKLCLFREHPLKAEAEFFCKQREEQVSYSDSLTLVSVVILDSLWQPD